MIFLTGSTGFIGSRLIIRLSQQRVALRVLIRPKKEAIQLPLNFPLDAAVSSLANMQDLRAALKGVETILHFATAEHQRGSQDYAGVDIAGTENLLSAAVEAGVRNILFLSRIGADKNSTFPLMKAKALAEDVIKASGLNYTILRLSDVYGKRDHLTSAFASFIKKSPGIMFLPSGKNILLQPIWIEDLISILSLVLEEDLFLNRIIALGGPEFYTVDQVVDIIRLRLNKRRVSIHLAPAYIRLYNLWFKPSGGSVPLSNYWMDLLAMNRTCAIDSIPRTFQVLPARMDNHLGYLSNE